MTVFPLATDEQPFKLPKRNMPVRNAFMVFLAGTILLTGFVLYLFSLKPGCPGTDPYGAPIGPDLYDLIGLFALAYGLIGFALVIVGILAMLYSCFRKKWVCQYRLFCSALAKPVCLALLGALGASIFHPVVLAIPFGEYFGGCARRFADLVEFVILSAVLTKYALTTRRGLSRNVLILGATSLVVASVVHHIYWLITGDPEWFHSFYFLAVFIIGVLAHFGLFLGKRYLRSRVVLAYLIYLLALVSTWPILPLLKVLIYPWFFALYAVPVVYALAAASTIVMDVSEETP